MKTMRLAATPCGHQPHTFSVASTGACYAGSAENRIDQVSRVELVAHPAMLPKPNEVFYSGLRLRVRKDALGQYRER